MKKSAAVAVMMFLSIAFVGTAFMAGCGSSNPSGPPGPGSTATPTPVATSTPAFYATPQTTPQAMVNMGTAANFAVLSYSGITNSGATTVCGNLGTFPSAAVDGGIALICGGTRQIATGIAATAESDLTTAYNDAMGRTGGASLPAGADIGGQTLYAGLYVDAGDLNVSSADVHLDAQGNPNAVFIFQVQGNLIVGPGRQVFLSNGAQASNVFWAETGYASLNTSVQFVGNVMAHTAVTMNTGSKLEGRALASTQNVTFLANTISFP